MTRSRKPSRSSSRWRITSWESVDPQQPSHKRAHCNAANQCGMR